MAATLESVAAERISHALAMLRQRVAPDQQDAVLRFAQPYLEGLDPEDVAQRDVLDLFGGVLSLWQFAHVRKPGEPKVRVFNPMVEEHGWHSPHTVVQIVNDD